MPSSHTPRIALLGSGIIAASRVPALRAAGLDVAAVASRPDSQSVHPFAERFGIPRVMSSWQDVVQHAADFDAFVVSTWPDGTPQVLEALIPLGRPILVEKPVAWNTATLRRLCSRPHTNVIVGYNRRHYRSVNEARDAVRNSEPVLAQLVLPTDVPPPPTYDPTGRYLQQFYESVSALGLDLTRFVLGDLKVESVQHLCAPTRNLLALAAVLSTSRGDLLQLSCPWRTAANYSLTISWPGRRLELLPFEIGTFYEGMEVAPPAPDYPIRRYLPKVQRRTVLEGRDLQEKPGFISEAETLRGMIEGRDAPEFVARLEDALAVTSLCEQLTGVTLGDTNPSPYHH